METHSELLAFRETFIGNSSHKEEVMHNFDVAVSANKLSVSDLSRHDAHVTSSIYPYTSWD